MVEDRALLQLFAVPGPERAQLAVQNIINFVTKTLEKAPPISAEQRQLITAVFEVGAK
jgi:hypothetical protein